MKRPKRKATRLHPLTVTWDEFSLRQRVVETHAAVGGLLADLALQFPADVVPRALFHSVDEACDSLAHGLAALDAAQHEARHRRVDAQRDVEDCDYRDSAEAIHGTYHDARHRHPRHRAAMRAEATPRPGGPLPRPVR